MQTTINNTLALGIPGEHGNTQPWYADSKIAGGTVTFGQVAQITDGQAVTHTDGTPVGIFVSPHEHVAMVYPSTTSTLSVPAGTTVAIAKRGTWYFKIKEGETWTVGTALYVNGAELSTTSSGSAVGEVIAVENGFAAVRIAF